MVSAEILLQYDDGCYVDLDRWYLDAVARFRTSHCFLSLIKSQRGFTVMLTVAIMLLQVNGLIWITVDP